MESNLNEDELAAQAVDGAVAVHRSLGPGLLESVYSAAMAIEMTHRGLQFVAEHPITAHYRERPLGVAYRVDMLLEGRLLLEFKTVGMLEPVHSAQVLSYLRLTSLKLGLLLNFNVPVMKAGIRRIVNGL